VSALSIDAHPVGEVNGPAAQGFGGRRAGTALSAADRGRWWGGAFVGTVLAVLCCLAGFSILTEKGVADQAGRVKSVSRLSQLYGDARVLGRAGAVAGPPVPPRAHERRAGHARRGRAESHR
jgi:hypothetical protein